MQERRSQSGSITEVIGPIPYRLALAGGWIDQPFVSQHNPHPPGSMVVVNVEPQFWFMDRSGLATSTRRVALRLWPNGFPKEVRREELVRRLYEEENREKSDPSGSQDMIGLIYPGISRLDYDFRVHGGVFPTYIENTQDPEVIQWLERVIHILPIAPRPEGYNPLEIKNLDPEWIDRLGQSGKQCYEAILRRDLAMLGDSFNECMACWEAILPCTVSHPAITVNLKEILSWYQRHYEGAMYSGCGGGYLYVVSEEPVPGSFHVKIRVENS